MIDRILKYIARSSLLSFGLLAGIVAETFIANALAKSKKTPKVILKVLSHHPLRLVRSFVAENTNTSPDIILKLSKEDANMVSYFAKKNPKLPKEKEPEQLPEPIQNPYDMENKEVLQAIFVQQKERSQQEIESKTNV